ncbi:MAG TPA: LLM class F420-dependent oxidoreductase, partial [Baekduia sp.]|nr:LLM class F420-dependent oxidoreductase [Baekduia sp.]
AKTITLMDHWFQMEMAGRSEDPMLEGYTGLGFLAGLTKRAQLGLLVTGVTYRHPGLLAKIVTTLDVLSGGRALFGMGAAWYEREHRALGVPYPPLGERFERLEEAIQICNQMWSDNDGPYVGKHYRLEETICSPQPLQAGGPPLLIGGEGEKKTLKLVARYADACNLYAYDTQTVEHKLAVLRDHCEAEERDYAEIHKTILAMGDPLDDVDGFLSSMEQYAALGVDQIWVGARTGALAAWTEAFMAKVQPRLADI